jgi:peptidoglycan DL-endopeptidase CwlO
MTSHARATVTSTLTAGVAALVLPLGLAAPASAASTPLALVGAQQQEQPPPDTRTLGDRALEEAPKHEGKPYRYGATGPDAFDCSGFVQYVFRAVGRELPRTSADQYAASEKIAQHDRRPGDLIAMRNSNGQVTHVGIYGGHDNWWVGSTSAGRMILQDLYSTNYSVGRFS